MQALLLGHSEFIVHSGLQLGGEPKYPDTHEQEGILLKAWQIAFNPQGEGTHGFPISGLSIAGNI